MIWILIASRSTRKVVALALREIELRRAKLQNLLDELGSRHIDTARAQFQLGSALWLSNKPLETHQAVKLFDSDLRFLTHHEPTNQILTAIKTIRDEALEIGRASCRERV